MKELHIGNKLFGSKLAFVIPSWVLNAQKGMKAEGDKVFVGPRRCGGWLTIEVSAPEKLGLSKTLVTPFT